MLQKHRLFWGGMLLLLSVSLFSGCSLTPKKSSTENQKVEEPPFVPDEMIKPTEPPPTNLPPPTTPPPVQ